ncbi:cysteine-rich CWC family protein [Bradyrhizobium prioriisuperbiae]|uniref:cysteine-rich CWC family protein n=1 Tax=Bradyrhizobium prioriisuperbiae TaxID=2854389 RepID=UPI0028EE63F8|nr:cysteine-rich CWC family protein [Bradyrhizobium prioritasuperba]
MTNPLGSQSPDASPARRLTCARCGTAFGCDLSATCWCHEETERLPMPVDGADCLCPDCLRIAADANRNAASSR